MSHGVDQLSRATRPSDRVTLAVDQISRATRARLKGRAVLTSSHGRLGPGSVCPRCLPAALRDSGLAPKSHGVDQLSQATWALARAPLCSNSYPLRPWTESEGTQFDQLTQVTWAHVRGVPDLTSCPGDSGPGPRARGVDHLSRVSLALLPIPAVSTKEPGRLGPMSECPRCQQALPGSSRLRPRDRRVKQLSRATRARVGGTAV